MNPHRGTAWARLFWGLIGAACVAIAVVTVAGIASGGYRPERYVGGFDPIRAGLIVFFAAFSSAFALLGGARLAARRSLGAGHIPLQNVVMSGAFVLLGASLLVFIVWMPASAGPYVVPIPIRVGILLGLGVGVAGLLPDLVGGASGAARRRDLSALVAVAILVAAIVIGFVSRR